MKFWKPYHTYVLTPGYHTDSPARVSKYDHTHEVLYSGVFKTVVSELLRMTALTL